VSNSEDLLYTADGHIAHIAFNRPDTLNAIDEDMHVELLEALTRARTDADIRVILLSAAGRAFSAGGDLNELVHLHEDAHKRERMCDVGVRLIETLIDSPVPIVAALQGDAIGLGASVALSADIIVASRTARLADTHVKVGLVAGDGGCLVWPMSMGLNRAKRYLLTGKMLPAEKACEFGLITDLVDEPEEALPAARAIAEEIAALAPMAVSGTKKALNKLSKARANEAFIPSMAYEQLSITSTDVLEAVASFREKRRPRYTGG